MGIPNYEFVFISMAANNSHLLNLVYQYIEGTTCSKWCDSPIAMVFIFLLVQFLCFINSF